MLLAGGQGQDEAALALRIHGLAAEPAGDLAQQRLAAGEQADIGAAEVQAVADRLALGHRDVGAHLAGGLQEAVGHRLGGDHDQQGAGRVSGLRYGGDVGDLAEDVGGLDHHAGGVGIDGLDHRRLGVHRRRQAGGGDASRVSQGPGRLGVVRVQAAGEHRLAPPRHPVGHHHRLGAGGGAVVHRGVGHRQAGQGRHLGLELEQHLQRALGDLRLVGGVAGQEFRALDDVVDAGRHMVAIGPRPAEERPCPRRPVPGRQGRQAALHRKLAGVGRQVDGPLASGGGGHIHEQLVDGGGADDGQHFGAVVGGEGQVAHGQVSEVGKLRSERSAATCPSPLAGEGGPRSGSDEGSHQRLG